MYTRGWELKKYFDAIEKPYFLKNNSSSMKDGGSNTMYWSNDKNTIDVENLQSINLGDKLPEKYVTHDLYVAQLYPGRVAFKDEMEYFDYIAVVEFTYDLVSFNDTATTRLYLVDEWSNKNINKNTFGELYCAINQSNGKLSLSDDRKNKIEEFIKKGFFMPIGMTAQYLNAREFKYYIYEKGEKEVA